MMAQNTMIEHAFFRLIRLAIGTTKDNQLDLTEEEWTAIYEMSKKQALVAIILDGVTELPLSKKPPMDLLMSWIGLTQQIEVKNKRMNKLVVMVCDKFREEGMGNILLKGQGLSALYARPLHRMPGDIDLWMEGGRKSIVKYVRDRKPGVEVVYHHVDFPVLKETEMELHFTPSWMNNWWMNRRLQRFFKTNMSMQLVHQTELPGKVGRVAVPTLAMNRIYLLVHIYRHLFDEGIGLRQLLDYYYVLVQPYSVQDKQETRNTARHLGILRFASAVMYVEQEVFGLDPSSMWVEPSEHYGKKLLDEIMLAGNFGKFNERIRCQLKETSWQRFCRKVGRNMTFLRDYPSEVSWSPLFKLWHYHWRKRNGYLPSR